MPNNRILVIADDSKTVYITSMILKLNDYDVSPYTFSDSTRLLANFRKDAYNLVLISSSNGDAVNAGVEICKKIRQTDNSVRICFMMNSQCKGQTLFSEHLQLDLVEQPVTADEMLALVTAQLKNR
jgi:DNA-binding NtrC family response regulator